jgi:predicted methyltransferase
MKSTVQNIVKAFGKAKNKADIATLQEAMSNIKSEIFDNRENIAKLYKTSTGRALNEFLKNIEERFNTTIENTSGNSVELKNAKTAYSKYKKIQKDLTDSYMVELRNQGK